MAAYDGSGGIGGGAANLENLSKALKCTQELRAGVSSLFEKLANGLRVSAGGGNSATDAQQSSTGDGEKEKVCLGDLRECLAAVNSDVEQLEKAASAIQMPQSTMTLGYLGFMTTDPFTDKLALSQQATQTYKWASKVQSQAYNALTTLHSNMPKRSFQGTQSAKRIRRPLSIIHTFPQQTVEMFLSTCYRYVPDLKITPSRPLGSPLVLEVTCGRTMRALIVLRGIAIEWAIIKAYHEDFSTENGKGLDLWSSSKYQVFRKITQHAKAVSLHFGAQATVSDAGIRQLLVWLNSYKSLFSTPCNKCGKVLQNYIPPTWHEIRGIGIETYHEHCRP